MSALTQRALMAFRLQRWEVGASVVGAIGLAAVMVWFSWQLQAVAAEQLACEQARVLTGCQPIADRWNGLSEWGTRLLYLSWVAPFGMGLLLGAPVVAREVEQRTAALAWILHRSRLRWLAWRVGFVAAVLIGLLAVVALASEALSSALLPTLDLDADFTWHGRRGWLIVARGVAALGIGLAVGALVGRTLPALLAAAFVSVLAFTAVSLGMDRWNQSEALVVSYDVQGSGGPLEGGLMVGQRVELLDGRVVGWDEVPRGGGDMIISMGGAIYTSLDEQTGEPDEDSLVGWERMLVVPEALYPVVVLRESGVVIGVALLFGLLAARIVARRRPG
ncbi:MAG TPA: hypothetical protein VFH63_00180 [candidate division Zixibacteria bacterium]|nr:hypothetical protein [candidate division Zixibacteria bacterium]